VLLPLLDLDATAAAIRETGISERLQTVNLLRTALHHPPVGRIIGDTIDALVLSGVLDARLREIAILRVGWRIGAAYEWGNHYPLARRIGLTDDEITAVREADPVTLPARERCVVRVVDEVLDQVLAAAGLKRPAGAPPGAVSGHTGRDGVHTEDMGSILAELQSVARAYPDATW